MKWFSYSIDSGMILHETAKEAEDAAKKEILDYRDNFDCVWLDFVDQVCWGEIHANTVMCECDYRLQAVKE